MNTKTNGSEDGFQSDSFQSTKFLGHQLNPKAYKAGLIQRLKKKENSSEANEEMKISVKNLVKAVCNNWDEIEAAVLCNKN